MSVPIEQAIDVTGLSSCPAVTADPSPLELADAALAGLAGPAVACVVRRRTVSAALDAAGALHEDSSTSTAVHVTRVPEGHPGLPSGPEAGRPHDGLDLATATASPAQAAAILREAAGALHEAAGTDGRQVTGRVQATRTTLALAATTGLRCTDDVTHASLDLAAADAEGGRPGRAHAAGRALRALDPAAVAGRAAAWIPRIPAAPAPPAGPQTVVLGAAAVAVLLDLLGRTAFDGRAHAAGRGPLSGRLGTRVAASAINLADTPRLPRTLPRAWDAEGVPKAPIPLIQDGVAHRVVHDLASAAAAGVPATGHATRGGSPRPGNLVLIGGGARDEAELAGPVDRGVLIPRLDGAEVADAASGLVTALAPDPWAIEAGVIAGPLGPLLLADLPLRILGATEALGAVQELTLLSDAGELPRGVVCPALRARDVPLAPAAAGAA